MSQDPSDIALAVFAQVQSLNETHNKFIRVSPHQEISAVSTSICDECHQSSLARPHKQQSNALPYFAHDHESLPPSLNQQPPRTLVPPSLPRPPAQTPKQLSTTSSTSDNDPVSPSLDTTLSSLSSAIKSISEQEPVSLEDNVLIDDDGYCEIDELRLPANFPSAAAAAAAAAEIKRQSTISADSIPEETEHEIHAELVANDVDDMDNGGRGAAANGASHHMELNDVYDTRQSVSEYTDSETMASSEHRVSTGAELAACGVNRLAHVTSLAPAIPCHLIHNIVSALNSQMTQLIVSALCFIRYQRLYYCVPLSIQNQQPRLQERDAEREKLRKENQKLRELLNAMHERERVLNDKVI